VFPPTGRPRWAWCEIWNHLANGGEVDRAAEIIGAITGLGPAQETATTNFAKLALRFLDEIGELGWSWRNAWPGGAVTPWVDRFSTTLRQYNREPVGGRLPTIARIWGAISAGDAAVIVDQENLRTWVWSNGACTELKSTDPIVRIAEAAESAARRDT